jgi:pectate lyase
MLINKRVPFMKNHVNMKNTARASSIVLIFSIFVLLNWIVLLPTPGIAKIYKYKDKNGRAYFTDDASRIPLKYRKKIKYRKRRSLKKFNRVNKPTPTPNTPKELSNLGSFGEGTNNSQGGGSVGISGQEATSNTSSSSVGGSGFGGAGGSGGGGSSSGGDSGLGDQQATNSSSEDTGDTSSSSSGGPQTQPGTPGSSFGVQAFPTAVGYGSQSVGGRGGRIIYVTTLEDTWNPGSLRHALYKESGPRIIVFRVAGMIELKEPRGASSKDIGIINPFVTVAGQTAPGGGVCIKNGGILIGTHDVIIRHLCVRPGDSGEGTLPEDRDAIKIVGGYNIILDHISASWSIDENISIWANNTSSPPRDITIQNSIISEGLSRSLHPKVLHSRGLLIGDHSTNVTVFQNVLAHNNRRNPLVKGDTGNIDIVNNVIYNWGNNKGFGAHFSDIENSGPTFTSIINNHFFKGPSSNNNYFYFDRVNENSRVLINGNIGDISEGIYKNSSLYTSVVDGAFNSQNIPVERIKDPFDILLQNSGAFIPARDSVDQRIIDDVKNKTGSIIDSPSDVGGYPRIAAGTPYRDSDKDGISDAWESSHNLNPNDSSDSNRKSGTSGYTNIEVFLNELAGD